MSGKTERAAAFAGDADERAYWEATDSAELLDWSKAQRVRFARLKPAAAAVTLCLPEEKVD
jgi:hypothetical protein